MTKPTKTDRKDIEVAEVAAAARHSPVVKALGWASELADQPELNTICTATRPNRRHADGYFTQGTVPDPWALQTMGRPSSPQ